MVNVSHLTKKYVEDSFLMKDYLAKGLINIPALAEKLKPRIGRELGKEIKKSAITMALRRYSKEIKSKNKTDISFEKSELIMKTGLCDITVSRSTSLTNVLEELHETVDYKEGDTLNIVQGDSDISIVINDKYKDKVIELLKGEDEEKAIINIEEDLVSISVRFGMEYLHTPGVTYTFLGALVMEGINLVEIISSLIEITFVIDKKDATKAYNALEESIES